MRQQLREESEQRREARRRRRELPILKRYFSALGAGDHPTVTPDIASIIHEKLKDSGKKGGLASRGKTSESKAAASRLNGLRGGRPKNLRGGRPKGSRKPAQAT